MKILVIPKPDVTFYDLFFGGKGFPKFLPRKLRWYFSFDQVSYEYPYYSDLVDLDDTDVDILGDIHRAYLEAPNELSTNPSGSYCPKVSGVNFTKVWSQILDYDAFVISSHTSKKIVQRIYEKKSKTSKVAIIEHEDHDDLGKFPEDKDLFRGFERGLHFDLYFKKDIPLEVSREHLFPLAPDPLRPKSFPHVYDIPMHLRKNVIFFSGIVNKNTTKAHRAILLNELSKIQGSRIIQIDVNDHYTKNISANSELFSELQRSQFVVCAPGRSWTTTRISMAAYFGCVPILCEPDIQTTNMQLTDGENCILYPNLRFSSDKFRHEVATELRSRIQELSSNTNHLTEMAARFKKMYFAYHSTHARAQYIRNILEDYKT